MGAVLTPRLDRPQVGEKVRASRKKGEDVPINAFTAGVYVATMMATVHVLREKVRTGGSLASHACNTVSKAASWARLKIGTL